MATVLTQAGEDWIVDVLDGALSVNSDYIGWGTGAGTAGKSDVDLFNPAVEARQVATRSQPTTDRVRWVATITATAAHGVGGGNNISNAGVFDLIGSGSPPSGGTPLIVHGDFTSVALAIGDSIQFTVELEIT